MKNLMAALLMLASIHAAHAGDIIDMTVVMTDMRGHPIPDGSEPHPADPDCGKCKPLTLGVVVAASLLSEDKDAGAVEKARRGALALSLLDNKAAKLTAAQINDIVRLMRIWPTIVLTRAMPLLDPAVNLSTGG